MIKTEDLVTLRRLTHAVMLHRGISRSIATQVVEDVLDEDNCKINLYKMGDDIALIEGEARWEAGVDFWNESAVVKNTDDVPDLEFWINYERHQQKCVDGMGLERAAAAKAAHFESLMELDMFVQRGESEMRRAQLMTADSAVDHLLEVLRDTSRSPLYDSGLLKIAIDVQKKYWADPRAMPKQQPTILEIREEYGLSEAEARAVERVACPVDRTRR